MAVLITGGAGFIGRPLARQFATAGYQVVAFDVAVPPPDAWAGLEDRITFVSGDIRDREVVRSIVREAGDGPIVHLSGIMGPACDRDPDRALAVNVHGTHHVLEAAREHGNRQVVLASTISVYGRGLPQPIVETMPCEPDGWYGLTKLMAEQLGRLYQRRHGLDYRAVRFAAVTGPGRTTGSGSSSLFTSYIAEKAARGEPYAIEVDEDVRYPVVYVKDAVRALFMLTTAPRPPRLAYNIGSGNLLTRDAVAAVKRRIPEAQFTYKPDPLIVAVVRGYSDWEINCQAAKEDLGWEPQFTVDDMVDDIIATIRGSRPENQGVASNR